jgi:hypothetical protein
LALFPLVAALEACHLDTDCRSVDELLGMLEAYLVLGFGLHLHSPFMGGLGFGFADVIGIIRLVHQHAQLITTDFDDATICGKDLTL